MNVEEEMTNCSYRLSEDLKMWRGAKDYYAERGWADLVKAADRQIERIAEQRARDYLNGRSSHLLGNREE